MRNIEYYFMVSIILWVIVMCITPVGGWTESNPYHDWYFWGFIVTAVNAAIAGLFVGFTKEKQE